MMVRYYRQFFNFTPELFIRVRFNYKKKIGSLLLAANKKEGTE